jgi:lysozyme
MIVNALLIALLKEFEGLKLAPYNCPAGHATIGYGHLIHRGPVTAQDIAKYSGFTKSDADKLLAEDAGKVAANIAKFFKVPLNANQFGACVSFAFNLGEDSLRTSTLLKHINESNFDDVGPQLDRWCHASVDGRIVELDGLKRRRAAEYKLWCTPA